MPGNMRRQAQCAVSRPGWTWSGDGDGDEGGKEERTRSHLISVPVAETSASGARLGLAKPAKSDAEIFVTRLPRNKL